MADIHDEPLASHQQELGLNPVYSGSLFLIVLVQVADSEKKNKGDSGYSIKMFPSRVR